MSDEARHQMYGEFLSAFAPEYSRAASCDHFVSAPAVASDAKMLFRYIGCVTYCGVEFYIDAGKDDNWNDTVFRQLFDRRDAIERTFGERLDWYEKTKKGDRPMRARYVQCESLAPIPERHEWPSRHQQLRDMMRRFRAALEPHLEAAVRAAEARR